MTRFSAVDLVGLALGAATLMAFFQIGLWCLMFVPVFLLGVVAGVVEVVE